MAPGTAAATGQPTAQGTPTSPSTRELVALGIAVLAGGLLRVIPFLVRPSLLLDEARISLNVASRSWLSLLRPLDYDQSAPPLFLWGVRLTTRLLGFTEYALRSLPLLAGLVTLPLIYLVARRLQPLREAILAVAIASASPLLIQYSREVKPYSLDLAVALLLLWLALRVMEVPDAPRRRRALLIGGAIAVWASTPAVLVLAGLATALLLRPDGASLRRFLAGAVGTWAVSFAAAYGLVYHAAATNPYLQQYWGGSFVTLWRHGAGARAWQGFRETVWAAFVGGTTEPPLPPTADLLADIVGAVVLLIAVLGSTRLLRTRGWGSLMVVVGPLVAAFAASAIGGYPVTARLLVYAVPSLVIPVAVGCFALSESFAARGRLATASAIAGILVLPMPRDIAMAAEAGSFENVRAAVGDFQRQARPGEPIYIFAAALPAWTFYTTDWPATDTVRLRRMARLGASGGPAFENAPPRTHALYDEGDSLVYSYRGHPELVGVFHGAQRRAGTGFVQHQPDTNWTLNEAHRIRAAADPAVWVLVAHSFGLNRFLFSTLAELGGRLDYACDGNGVELRRYRFRE